MRHALSAASLDHFAQRHPQPLQAGDFLVHLGQFRFRFSRDRTAFRRRFDALRKQLLDFLQRESEPLRIADETQAVEHVFGIIPVAREISPRRRDQSLPLVEADSVYTHSRRISYSANRHLSLTIDP